ncbi:hypothetical protein [Acidithiobacillus sp.]|uniref:hypothetical protein n=1 Tax=Acidithiobacillus sp. TaxID=1872118 RepID=UPI0031FE8A61
MPRAIGLLTSLLLFIELAVYTTMLSMVWFVGETIAGFFTGSHLAALIAIHCVHIILGMALVILLARGWKHCWVLFSLYGVYYFVLECLWVIQPNGPSYVALIDAYQAAERRGSVVHLVATHYYHYPNWGVYVLFAVVAGFLLVGSRSTKSEVA